MVIDRAGEAVARVAAAGAVHGAQRAPVDGTARLQLSVSLQGLLSDEHFTVDGTLIEAWAGHKSFKRKADDRQTPPDDPGNPSVDFHGERRRNATHQSTTDPEARLARKGAGKEAKLSYAGHVEMDNRHGLVVNTRLTQASGRAEPEAALAMLEEIAGFGRITLGADKGYDQKELVRELREHRVTPHVAQKPNSAIDGRTTRRPGYLLSQRRRKRVEDIFEAGSRPWAGCARLVIADDKSLWPLSRIRRSHIRAQSGSRANSAALRKSSNAPIQLLRHGAVRAKQTHWPTGLTDSGLSCY